MTLQVYIGPTSPWLVTASIKRSWRGLGPHANVWGGHYVEFNWLLKEQRELKPEDIFRAGSGWEKELQTRCDTALRKEFHNYDSAAYQPEIQEMVSNPSRWHFESDSLAIFQVKGQSLLSPVRMSWDDLKPFLRQGLVIPKQK